MKPDLAVELANKLAVSRVRLGALIADDDAATFKQVGEEVDD